MQVQRRIAWQSPEVTLRRNIRKSPALCREEIRKSSFGGLSRLFMTVKTHGQRSSPFLSPAREPKAQH